jgi:hypothetical protein
MSRNNSGTYTLPAGNPVVSGSVISSVWANDTMSDIAAALTDSLSRSGKGGMSAAFRTVDGTVSVPGVSFNSETSSGFYRAGAGDIRLSILGSDILQATSIGSLLMQSSTAYYPQITLRNKTNDVNAPYYAFDKDRNGASVQNGDILGNIVFRGYDGANYLQAAAIIAYVNGTPGTNDMPGSIGIFTTADGASSPTRRVYIDQAGDMTLDHINANTSAQTANVYADANGKLYKGAQPSSFPSGTVMLFVQTSAPTGWTKSTTHDNKALRVVSGTASSGGSIAFTTAFANGNAGSTTLSTAQMPSHNHQGQAYAPSNIGGSNPWSGFSTTATLNNFTSWQLATNSLGAPTYLGVAYNGGGGSHTHSLSLAVQYVDVIIATKN